jgi:hypothetical protein
MDSHLTAAAPLSGERKYPYCASPFLGAKVADAERILGLTLLP